MSQLICLTPTPSAQGIACPLSKFRRSVFIAQQLAGGRGHVYSRPPCAAPSSGTTMSQMTCPTPALSAPRLHALCVLTSAVQRFVHGIPCPTRPILYKIRYCPQRQSFALEGASVPETTPPPSVSSPLATARVPTARVSITARELTTNRSVVVPSDWGGGSARGAAPSSLRASPDSTTGSNLKTSSGGNPFQAATASSTRELATSGVTLVTVSSTILDNDDGNPPPTVRWWFPAIEEMRQHEEQRLVRFERRQVGYRGNGQYQQFGRAHHQQQYEGAHRQQYEITQHQQRYEGAHRQQQYEGAHRQQYEGTDHQPQGGVPQRKAMRFV
ncbi:hypothetical protein VTO58DRAFT_108379 [Aureobasidium pullulans]